MPLFLVCLVAIAQLIPLASTGAAQTPPTPVHLNPFQRARVQEIVNSDAIRISLGHREDILHFSGIDNPETRNPNSPVECYGAGRPPFWRNCSPLAVRVVSGSRVERVMERWLPTKRG